MSPKRSDCEVTGVRVDPRLLDPAAETYPEGLRDLESPPAVFVTGTMVVAPAIAVVGTRRCTRYGVDLARAFGRGLAEAGWSVVSGLARGIDAAAHWGVLDGSGHALGVVASGLDIWYPAENRPLYRGVLDGGGALVSEYPLGTPPDRWRFPARNRLIAAVASATVVVEAGETGGALITARLAAEMGRPVFVVPGDVDRAASVGCNRLIRDGAHPVLGVVDLIEELELALGPAPGVIDHEAGLLPPQGVAVEDLASYWDCSVGDALRRLGRLEASGQVRQIDGMAVPEGA